jgi:hypothetical protein
MFVNTRMKPVASCAFEVRRRDLRYVSSIPVALQRFLRFGPSLTRGVSLDISARGMSALVCGAPRVGETVVIGLPLPDAPLEVLATVRHSSDAKSGFEFYPMSPIVHRTLEDWLLELGKYEEKLFPYPLLALTAARKN